MVANPSPLLKSSLLLPQTRARSLTYRIQGRSQASPSCLGESWLSVEGTRLPEHALSGLARAPAGRNCTPPGHPIISLTLIKNSLNSVARYGHEAWSPTSLPNSIVLLSGWYDVAELTAEIVPGFEKWSSFHHFFVAGGGTFELRHSGLDACGIPDEDTVVMTGGFPSHDYVTR